MHRHTYNELLLKIKLLPGCSVENDYENVGVLQNREMRSVS